LPALRKTIALFLLVNTLGTVLAVPLIYLDYQLRKDYIYQVLCIKKDKPITLCGGKCYLVSNLKKASETDQKATRTNTPIAEISLFFGHASVNLHASWSLLESSFQSHNLAEIPAPLYSPDSPPPQRV
jgi:hypothetical protein